MAQQVIQVPEDVASRMKYKLGHEERMTEAKRYGDGGGHLGVAAWGYGLVRSWPVLASYGA